MGWYVWMSVIFLHHCAHLLHERMGSRIDAYTTELLATHDLTE